MSLLYDIQAWETLLLPDTHGELASQLFVIFFYNVKTQEIVHMLSNLIFTIFNPI